MISASFLTSLVAACILIAALFVIPGCSTRGVPMRTSPDLAGAMPKTSWLIQGRTKNNAPVSCSFVEFDERGDFLDFGQHTSCEMQIKDLVRSNKVLVVIYCHGWKNSSQSGDVISFNAFLTKLAESDEIINNGIRVHGIYLGWRGNPIRPYVDKSASNESYRETVQTFGKDIVDSAQERSAYWTGVVAENLTYWNRKNAAEHLVSGLPMARAIFTYAAAAKDYGKRMDNRVCVMGHSFGALMLERSLGQAMTGELTMEWWEGKTKEAAMKKTGLPFDLVLFVNSAAPAIYAKETRDFLKAHRSALGLAHNPAQDVPVIISLTSTADSATGILHPIGNMFAPFDSSLSRYYTTGILGQKQANGSYPQHRPIRQSEFYTKTPGHHPYLINHWIVKDDSSMPANEPTPAAVFSSNLDVKVPDPDVFLTSKAKWPASAWRLTTKCPGTPVLVDGLSPSMSDSDYWIVSCGEKIISGHNDVWSRTAMETYAGLFRAVESRRLAKTSGGSSTTDTAGKE